MSQDSLKHKQQKAALRRRQTRDRLSTAGDRPRLSVHISNLHVSAQIIDQSGAKTLAYATSVGQKIDGGMSKKAAWVGEEIARKTRQAKIKRVAFDRGSRLYHGRVKILAEAA